MQNCQSSNSIIEKSFYSGFMPDLDLSVDEWSDRHMIIPKSSGSNEYGPYKTSRTPHAREVMQALSDNHPCKRVVCMVASQMFKTQTALNWLGSTIHQSPSNFLWLMPTGKLHKRIAARIDKTIAAVPELKERVAKPNSREAQNNLDTKEYIGGALFIATAGAAANLSEVPARRVAFDEIDRADANVEGEGDPVKLAEARQTTFAHNKKSYYYSSPTIEGESKIHDLFNLGTQRYALAECVHCGHAQEMVFERLVLSDDGQNAIYPCIECGGVHHESDKTKMFSKGLWSDGVAGDGETQSFCANAMFLPYGWLSWRDLMREYEAAKELLEQGIEETMIVFYNTRLARCWERKKEQTKHDVLMARAEPYDFGQVPEEALYITAAVDTQDNRLEYKAVAWGEKMERWVLDYKVLYGSPGDEELWSQLDQILLAGYDHPLGVTLPIETTFIDTGGHFTQEVYNFVRGKQKRGVFGIKGVSQPGKPILGKRSPVDINYQGKFLKNGAYIWMIGTDTAKDYIMAGWKRAEGKGCTHFSHQLEEQYYKQLVAEYRTLRTYRGKKVSAWDLKEGDRNEAGDLMVYNLAAAHFIGLHTMTERQFQLRRNNLIKWKKEEIIKSPEVAPQKRAKSNTFRRGRNLMSTLRGRINGRN